MAQVYTEETEKSYREILNSKDELLRYWREDPEDKFLDMLGEVGMPMTHEDMEYIEHRIYHDYVGSVDF